MTAGPEAIAVVLSGFGNDGAAGVTAVKRLDGTVIASDLATSQQTSMPEAAIDTGQVKSRPAPRRHRPSAH